MSPSRALVAASCIVLLSARFAAAGSPKTHAAHANGNAEAEAYRKQMQHEQAQAEKLMRQQQQQMQQEMKRVQQQQAQMQARAAKQQAQVAKVQQTQKVAGAPGVVHHGATYHHEPGYRTFYHRNHVGYRHHTRWPTNVLDPETAALVRLKHSLDGVARGSTHAPHTASLASALGGVVEIDTPPTPAAVQTLATHLSHGMAHRQAGPVNTEVMALALRAVMNSTILPRGELAVVVKQHQAAIRSAHFQPGDITAIDAAMETVVTQERSRR